MKKRILFLLLMPFYTSMIFAFNGNGTAESPYQLTNQADLVALSEDVNDLTAPNSYDGKHFILTQDIDLSSINEWTPIGVDIVRPFEGVIDGNGNEIKGVTITGEGVNKALFGFIKQAQLKNIGVTGSVAGADNLAGIVAVAINSTISNCFNSASVTATGDNAGGIVGIAYGTEIKNCYNKGAISAQSAVGGIVGVVYKPEEIYEIHTNNNGIANIKAGYEKLPYHFIPSKIGATNIARVYDNFLKDNTYVQELEIQSTTLTNFHSYVCSGAVNLKKVTINSTKPVGLGNYCFAGCMGLTGSFVIPDCVTALGAAFMTDCRNLEELHISVNVASIGRAFLSLHKLEKLYLPRTTMITLTNADAFGGLGSKLPTGEKTIIYVPADLVDSYKTDTNWSKFADQFQPLP